MDKENPELKAKKLSELMAKEEDDQDAGLVAELIGEDGQLKVDLAIPAELETEVMAQMIVDHLISYVQTKAAYRSARNTADHARAKQLFEQMQYNQLTVAIIQHDYPQAKPLAEAIGKARAKEAEAKRRVFQGD